MRRWVELDPDSHADAADCGGLSGGSTFFAGCGGDNEHYGECKQRQLECGSAVDGDMRRLAVRIVHSAVNAEWSGDDLYCPCCGSDGKYGDSDGDLGDGHHEVCFGNDYDYGSGATNRGDADSCAAIFGG